MRENNFLKQNNQHRVCKTRGFCKNWKKNSKRPKDKHNGIDEKEFV